MSLMHSQVPSTARGARAMLPAVLCGVLCAALVLAVPQAVAAVAPVSDPSAEVDPLIGTSHGGNVFPGAVVPFGMLAWSPETTRGDRRMPAAPGGYSYNADRVRGFSLTHLSGTGCTGASGDIPFMPMLGVPTQSPSAEAKDERFIARFSHVNERAEPGYYAVRLDNEVKVELGATARTGAARFTYPAGKQAVMLIRASDSQLGSSDAEIEIDPAQRTVRGSVTSGNFCGYIDAENRRSYYTLHFVAVFDQPFDAYGTWQDDQVRPGTRQARGGTGYGPDGHAAIGKGAGGWLDFGAVGGRTLGVRVGISYVSRENAQANLDAENAPGTTFDTVRADARRAWNRWLSRIEIEGGDRGQRRIFRTALYHALMHPNLFSDANGEYRGFDGKVHRVRAPQQAQYANFSGWDVYRSQVQLVALLDTGVGSDIAQSLLNQAEQNGGVWDRWTHNNGATHVMTGDPSAPSVAAIHAFGGRSFDVERAFRSLVAAAERPTALDADRRGCPVMCVGQRPDLARRLRLGYLPADTHAWGGGAETLEQANADFGLAALAERLGRRDLARRFLRRAGEWRNLYNPKATPGGGYIQNRNADGTWPAFDPAADEGFAEGSAAQYLWMVPFDVPGLVEALGGTDRAIARLDALFRSDDGDWALTRLGGAKVEMDNEPSVATPWLYTMAGQPWKTQAVVAEVLDRLWKDAPDGIPGNDDLGAMSSWHVWSALGMYPLYPGRAELVLGAPRFTKATIRRATGDIVIEAPQAAGDARYVAGLQVNGAASTRPWLPASFVASGGHLRYTLSEAPAPAWGSARGDAPPDALRDVRDTTR